MTTFVGRFGFAALSAPIPRYPQVVVSRLEDPSPILATITLVPGQLIDLLVANDDDALRGVVVQQRGATFELFTGGRCFFFAGWRRFERK